MINWYSQLTQLILSFYREDRSQLQQLQFLRTCKLSRRWGVFQIRCTDHETAQALINVIDLLRAPIAELRLAQQIKIMVNGTLITTFPVKPSKLKV
ncbi:MAG TPA: hypothetical protein V6C57_25660 [Coleofasciculaceae cyanobacterium]